MGDRHDGEGRAHPIPRGGQASGQAAVVGEPFQRIAHGAPIDNAATDATNHRRSVEHGQRTGIGVGHPAKPHQDTSHQEHGPETALVDQPALKRHEPGLHEDKNREGQLNGGTAPLILLVDRVHKQGPPVLQIGDGHHTDDANDQLQDPVSHGRRCGAYVRGRSVHVLPSRGG
jgi:hypothetical protein